MYGSAAAGSAGISLAAETSGTCHIDNAFKLLTSANLEVRELALQALTNITFKRLCRPATPENLSGYLSPETEGDFRARARQLQSVWTEARKASRRLGVSWQVQEHGAIITFGKDTLTPSYRTKAVRTLRSSMARARDHAFQDKPNQGKLVERVTADITSSQFMWSGHYTRFCEWRFVHRARLNLLPLNAARLWAHASDRRCRVCGYSQETLSHVLRHCISHNYAFTSRHNKIVDRVKTATAKKLTVIHENRPVGDTTVRPDLVMPRRGDDHLRRNLSVREPTRVTGISSASKCGEVQGHMGVPLTPLPASQHRGNRCR
ncbi:uncharacterized protein LOC125945816 [Dermacentor silvarum]|uniref:uncharacterized protein LOC125945816 n=1 Tax=Dermacentor silvarum TaxID=543639 RepID=UPI0021017868|nr:uncharacterized protein LOC125945816 [Dermacentor silvarum]